MLDSRGFDLWADGYDRSVDISDEDNTYPFAGYKKVLAGIYDAIRKGNGKRVLDIGFGTGILAGKLYENGYDITGIDFSERMIQIAKEKMPSARLIQHDFSKGLPAELADSQFDVIICTYAIHHLDNDAKIAFLKELQTHLLPAGKILIGDVAFDTREEWDICRENSGDEWDEDEFYIVAEDIRKEICGVQFEKISYCAGILTLGTIVFMKLDPEQYAGQKFTVRYMTNGYYDIHRTDMGFQIAYERFEKPMEMFFDDYMFNEWLEDPVAYGAFENGQFLGYVEGTLEKWNNRYRISNICVFDNARRHGGIGTVLMNTILQEAKESGARMVVLETQTCNENAIAFYCKNGFDIIGFDLFAYTNTDPERHEIRIEMGKKL